MLTIALIAVAAVWLGVVDIAIGLCASAARADRVPRGRFVRVVAR